MNDVATTASLGLAPFSLKNAPAFIEQQFPVGRLSAEAYKERKAGSGQTLTALGSYWKGRKPLILCRAVTLGCLLPATDDPVADLEIFLSLMAMDDDAFARRWDGSAAELSRNVPDYAERLTELTPSGKGRRWRDDLTDAMREAILAEALATLPYSIDGRLKVVRRPEECDEFVLLAPVWERVNAHLGTNAKTLPQLVEQLGIARYGHLPKLADTFCGGGSIPFEAARIGCDVHASDLNPVACMLTWGAFNIVGAPAERKSEIAMAQAAVAAKVEAKISAMKIEHDSAGNRSKTYLYCLETRCPRTGWMVPMAPSWVISKTRNVIAKLVPDHDRKRYLIEVMCGVSADEMAEAERGTVQGGRLVHPMNSDKSGVEIKIIRGDKPGGGNALRQWSVCDFMPRVDDTWQERLYCIQWITADSLRKGRQETFFASVTEDDLAREATVNAYVASHLNEWQDSGLVPDMPIQPGANTSQPIWERGWTHWHHLFGARALLNLSLIRSFIDHNGVPCLWDSVNYSSRLCRWETTPKRVASDGSGKQTGGASDNSKDVFSNQALNTFYNYASRSFSMLHKEFEVIYPNRGGPKAKAVTQPISSFDVTEEIDIYVTDPPYADAVNYHEITEFFIAWLRKNPPAPFDQWIWDSRRKQAIKGKDADFRRAMVEAYGAMTRHMADNGMQVVMFTHQDAGVWADLAGILWAAGLRVTAAWNIVTETDNAMRSGNYVQGTVCLVLRKRKGEANARRMEIEEEIESEVKLQLSTLTNLDGSWTAATGGETLYTDGDLTLAAYAAALRVVTKYATIDRRDVGADVFRDVPKKEVTPLRALIDYAASVANRELVPRGFPRTAWRDLDPASRFYVRMLDMEARGNPKVADFQNFAKSFAFANYTALMGSSAANAASLAGAETLKGKALRDPVLSAQPLFQLLFAIWKTIEKNDPKIGVAHLRVELGGDYWTRRVRLAELADYIAAKTATTRAEESEAAALLAEALKVDRL